jgi:hypothetical protein
MALLLLKFPHAPKEFRASIARTLAEEQDHLKLYVGRMRELGVDFGDLPVSDYFWSAMKDVSSPLEFVTQMSLTLEQANLDYSLYYFNQVAETGDLQTSAVLEKVYLDEIGHVKNGLIWFNRLRKLQAEGEEDEWDAYLRLLPPPMTPRRAKGVFFFAEPRQKAGFSERFIREIEVYEGSKGRPPVFWIFNPLCEAEIVRGKPGLTPTEPARRLSQDLETLPMYLALKEDVLLVSEAPRAEYLREMREIGFDFPEFRKNEAGLLPREEKIAGFQPWGWSPEPFVKFKPLRSRLTRADGANGAWCKVLLSENDFSATGLAPFFSKAWSVKYLRENLHDPEIFGPAESVGFYFENAELALEKIRNSLSEKLVLKAPFGTSGTKNKRVFGEADFTEKLQGWVRNTVRSQGGIVVEPWLESLADLSLQLEIRETGVEILGIRRFANGSQSEYRGTWLDPKLVSLPDDCVRYLYSSIEPLESWRRFALKLGEKLRAEGYLGPAGIDGLLWKSGEKLFLKPLVELNPRFTMGRIALELEKRVSHGAPAFWRWIPLRELKELGLPETPVQAAACLKKEFPLKLSSNRASKRARIQEGIVFTTDPTMAREVLTVLAVGTEAIRRLGYCKIESAG